MQLLQSIICPFKCRAFRPIYIILYPYLSLKSDVTYNHAISPKPNIVAVSLDFNAFSTTLCMQQLRNAGTLVCAYL